MAVTTDILRSYRRPGEVIREKLGEGVREDRALAYLMMACFLIFVAQWPRLARQAQLESIELQPLIGATLMAWLFIAPLLFYGLAALSRLIARAFGGQGTGYAARLALFWSLLAATPLWLLYGLVAGLIGRGPGLTAIGVVALAAFLLIWGAGLRAAEAGAV